MDFEGIFNRNSRPYKKMQKNKYSSVDGYRQNSFSKSLESFNPRALISSLRNSRKLKIIIFVIVLILLAIIIGVIAILYPLMSSIINYILENGFSGLIDEMLNSLDKIWNGSK